MQGDIKELYKITGVLKKCLEEQRSKTKTSILVPEMRELIAKEYGIELLPSYSQIVSGYRGYKIVDEQKYLMCMLKFHDFTD